MKLLLFLQALRLSFHFSSIHFYIISHHPHKFIQCGSRCGILLLLHISDGHIIHTKVSLCLCIFQDTNSYQSVEKSTQLFDNRTLQKKSIFSCFIACILLLISYITILLRYEVRNNIAITQILFLYRNPNIR